MRIKKKVARVANQATSAEIVASIDDLLIHILLLLPTRSLVLFKSVLRHWVALITNSKFSLLRNPYPNPATGLYLQRLAFGVEISICPS
ncbi:hypothetical protein LIER_16123 [Lithospermum erythrorhizon]|uniref:F-box domain-containing protein n=1 Tax=Lithospermum erythrorhizon TaxID=34254 RepID=A0AAV3Q804_LITER